MGRIRGRRQNALRPQSVAVPPRGNHQPHVPRPQIELPVLESPPPRQDVLAKPSGASRHHLQQPLPSKSSRPRTLCQRLRLFHRVTLSFSGAGPTDIAFFAEFESQELEKRL